MIPCMNEHSTWQKTRYANLIRYVPSQTYFIRAKVNGKLIRESLETGVETVARLKLADRLKVLRNQPRNTSTGNQTYGQAEELYKASIEANADLKPLSKTYRLHTLAAISRNWPSLAQTEIRRIADKDCKKWAVKMAAKYAPSRYNGIIQTLRAVFALAMENGALAFNPAASLEPRSVKQKKLTLPTDAQFAAILKHIDGVEPKSGELVRGLAYSGMRKGEARNFLMEHANFEKERLAIHGDPEYGTKNSEVRYVPMFPQMRSLLEKFKAEKREGRAFHVDDCRYSLAAACKAVGCARITAHDLRHYFATKCIESGVDIPTVSRWLGHKDGGTLAMKTYGHLRDEHSAEMAKRVSFPVSAALSV